MTSDPTLERANTGWTPAVQVLVLAGALALIKVALSAQVAPTTTEAYYWMYGRHPAWSYFDHPGMIGWISWLTSALFGDGLLQLRLLTILAGSLSIWLTFLAGRALYDERVGILGALTTAAAPLFFAQGSRLYPDAPMLLFWIATIWAAAHAVPGRGLRWWLLAGLCAGLALESKYHALFLVCGIGGFLAFSPEHRFWLRRKEPWLGALVAAAAFAPTLAWNASHGWSSFRYQGLARFSEGNEFSWKLLTSFPASHLVLMTPFLCVTAWMSGARTMLRWTRSPWPDRLLAAVGFPLLLFFVAVTPFRSIRDHWAAPAYVGLLILSASAIERGRSWAWKLHVGTVAVLAAGYVALPLLASAYPESERTGWSRLAEEIRQQSPDFILAPESLVAAQLGYQLRPVPACDFTALGRPTPRFGRWWSGESFRGKTAVLVFEKRLSPEHLLLARASFERVAEPLEVTVARPGRTPVTWLLVRGEGYRPPDTLWNN